MSEDQLTHGPFCPCSRCFDQPFPDDVDRERMELDPWTEKDIREFWETETRKP